MDAANYTPTELGAKVKDQLTGFTGTATAKSQHLHGPARVLVESKSPQGHIINEWIDEPRLTPATD